MLVVTQVNLNQDHSKTTLQVIKPTERETFTSKSEEPIQKQGQNKQIQPYFMLPNLQSSLPGIKAIVLSLVPSPPLAVGPDCLIEHSCFDLFLS